MPCSVHGGKQTTQGRGGTAWTRRTNEAVSILIQTQVRHKVGTLLFSPLGDDRGGAALGVPRMGEGGGGVFGAHGAGGGGRAFGVFDGEGRALDDAALVFVVGVRVLAVVFGC